MCNKGTAEMILFFRLAEMVKWVICYPEFLVLGNPNIMMEGPKGPRIKNFSLKRPMEKILNHTLKRYTLPHSFFDSNSGFKYPFHNRVDT